MNEKTDELHIKDELGELGVRSGPLPNTGTLSGSDLFRINATAWKINDAFNKARAEARDEALWLSSTCRLLLAENDRFRTENEKLRAKLARVARDEE